MIRTISALVVSVFFESRRQLLKEGIDFGHRSGYHTGHHALHPVT